MTNRSTYHMFNFKKFRTRLWQGSKQRPKLLLLSYYYSLLLCIYILCNKLEYQSNNLCTSKALFVQGYNTRVIFRRLSEMTSFCIFTYFIMMKFVLYLITFVKRNYLYHQYIYYRSRQIFVGKFLLLPIIADTIISKTHCGFMYITFNG